MKESPAKKIFRSFFWPKGCTSIVEITKRMRKNDFDTTDKCVKGTWLTTMMNSLARKEDRVSDTKARKMFGLGIIFVFDFPFIPFQLLRSDFVYRRSSGRTFLSSPPHSDNFFDFFFRNWNDVFVIRRWKFGFQTCGATHVSSFTSSALGVCVRVRLSHSLHTTNWILFGRTICFGLTSGRFCATHGHPIGRLSKHGAH